VSRACESESHDGEFRRGADKSDLDKLGARLEAAKARHTPEPRDVAISALAQGTRHAFEIAATTIVGAGIGLMLDRWLQTGPWMFLLFLLLGIAAGFWNLIKAVNVEAAAVRSRAADRKALEKQGRE
jgi:ATP synthase protein I